MTVVKKIGLGLTGILVVAGVIFIIMNRAGHTDASFKLVKVERGTIVDKALAIGRIDPENEIGIKSKISGLVKKIYVEIGDSVRAGDPLIEIAPDPTPLEYAEAKRGVELAALAYDNAKRDFDRSQEMLTKKLISDQEFERARQKLDETDLQRKLAEERLSLIEKGKTTVADKSVESILRSPITGTILARKVNQGDPVVPLTTYQEGTELLTLASMANLIFKGTVDEIDVGKLKVGMPADIKVGAIPGAKVKGILYKISPKARKEDNTVLFDVEIHLTEVADTTVLRAGYSANAEIVINRKDSVLVLPERLVTFRSDSSYVEIPNELGEPKEISIKTGLSDGLQLEILAGLDTGQQVIERPPKKIE
ncbi:MAG: efflux RND transporter periplasmic adaptor subunit [candidate division Zixibacteria bacterium]|nr:efflux RND transporter periplasmic adaptor subunit [candidate division Zixibacteria bacterium]